MNKDNVSKIEETILEDCKKSLYEKIQLCSTEVGLMHNEVSRFENEFNGLHLRGAAFEFNYKVDSNLIVKAEA